MLPLGVGDFMFSFFFFFFQFWAIFVIFILVLGLRKFLGTYLTAALVLLTFV